MKLCAIGCGEHAASSHGPALARYTAGHPEIELAACCDVDPERAERHRVRFGFARAYTDPLAMIAAERPDAAVLVVPEAETCAVGVQVLERGVPLLIEKPPGRTLDEVDRLAAAADRRGADPVPHQVAFNRRFVPLIQAARRMLDALGSSAPIQHLHYEMTRVDRRDPDFSATAIHGFDAVRFLAGSDFTHARFRYREMPEQGTGVANILVDAVLASGATAQLAFCPVAGVVVERATVHAGRHTLHLRVPMWGAVDSPGRLEHFEGGTRKEDLSGAPPGEAPPAWELGGFYGEYEAFLGDLQAGRVPAPSLRDARQSVAIAACVSRREGEYIQ
jgi:myo-inositol 2-dehydrogenase/D-chiro-inositol 1-dehydrogenase